MEYAVIETGGKQYRVAPGQIIEVDKLEASNGSVSFENVLLYVSDAGVQIGKPYLVNMSVAGKVLKSGKGDKIRVARFTAKSRHRRVVGFRPQITTVQIEKVVESAAAKTTKTSTSSKTVTKVKAKAKK